MMTEEQRYLFDLQGFLVLRGVLDAAALREMHADMDAHDIKDPANNPTMSRFGQFLRWGPRWRDLIDHEAVLPVLRETLGPRFRLDHAYGMAARVGGEEGHFGLHHEAGMFHHGCYYVTHGQKMHNGLLVVSWALTDVPEGAGGFCCVPGSHKSIYPTPKTFYSADPRENPALQHVAVQAGDVIFFTEALTHGTMRWTHEACERRAVLLKYCPHYMAWTHKPMEDDIEGLTERQRLILQPPYVNTREDV